ncbi:hypothetical protein F6S87_06350 [Bifidobacterium sp. BRDM6]|uniref:Glycosyltransferase n=1 Tax=Bifidobacterium choloepi TaxID=2614131 RepID=A0A6I5N173_9BIFI|nr:hypothetical protein [Bifidobacterium choloepi]NEG70216.1 hypothetical protein [Bifidobacterium choloepi]
MAGAAVAALLIALVEIVGFNLPYWTSIAASTDSASANNALGSGLERLPNGMVKVTDPTQAYFTVVADGSSDYYHAIGSSPRAMQDVADLDTDSGTETLVKTVYLRAVVDEAATAASGGQDSTGRDSADQSTTATASVCPYSAMSMYFKAPSSGTVRVWVEEPAGSIVPISNIRANVRVPFNFNWARVAVMAFVVLLVWLWRPGSRLWRMRLDTSSVRQRCWLAGILGVAGAVSLAVVVQQIATSFPLAFHLDGGYTYDFDQYGHVADALLHGHVWLDLPVPDQLAALANPYDVTAREALKAQGVTPIYWDYAFHDGHWYSYFGVLPALLLFLPFQAVTSLFGLGTDGAGMMLPASCAELLLMFGFLVFATLLVVRLLRRCCPRISLAATSMTCALFLFGSNAVYLWYRTNFYSIPFAASLFLCTMGLWFWLGAARPAPTRRRRNGTVHRYWSVPGSDAPALSLARVGAGALCIAATVGCRPTFALTAILAFPVFWPQIRAMWRLATGVRRRAVAAGSSANRHDPAGRTGESSTARTVAATIAKPLVAVLLPAVALLAVVCWYNIARFGSPFDFGNDYQITVTDMTVFSTPLKNMAGTLFYYLLLPLRFTSRFPFLEISPTPLPEWSFTEPSVGGLLLLAPAVVFALAAPFVRKRFARTGCWGLMVWSLALGVVLLLFDARVGGFGWRYMCDFGWLFMIAAVPVIGWLLGTDHAAVSPAGTLAGDDSRDRAGAVAARRRWLTWLCRALLLALTLFSLAIAVLSLFTIGRDDSMVNNNPGLYAGVASWFTLL